MILHTRTILRTATTNLHNTVLLDIMSLARNQGRDNLARAQSYTGGLALAGVGLLGLRDPGLETHALEGGGVFQCWGAGPSCALVLSNAASYLVEGCADDRGAGEGAFAGRLAEGLGEGLLGAEDGLEGESGRGLASEGLCGGCKSAEGCW